MKIAEQTAKEINENKEWTSWKCACGCLNNRGNGNCGRCGFYRHYTDRHYGANGDVFINGVLQIKHTEIKPI